jgi:hypothetical protein
MITFLNYTKPQTQESKRTPGRINTKTLKPQYIIFKLLKIQRQRENFERSQRKRNHLL